MSTVLDHGFRALSNDPMFDRPYNWPRRQYSTNPANANGVYPQNVASAAWLKRQLVQAVLRGNISQDALFGEGGKEGIDCNSCDIVIDEQYGHATYVHPKYEENSGYHQSEPVRTTAEVATSTHLTGTRPTADSGSPMETAASKGPDALRKYLYGIRDE